MSKPYTYTIEPWNTRTGPAIRCKAIIRPSAKRGIKVRRQKTFTLRTIAPKFTTEEMRPSIEAQFDRWASKQLQQSGNI